MHYSLSGSSPTFYRYVFMTASLRLDAALQLFTRAMELYFDDARVCVPVLKFMVCSHV